MLLFSLFLSTAAMPTLSPRKFLVIERKSFNVVLEGKIEDIIKTTENGDKQRFSFLFFNQEMVHF